MTNCNLPAKGQPRAGAVASVASAVGIGSRPLECEGQRGAPGGVPPAGGSGLGGRGREGRGRREGGEVDEVIL